MTIDEAYELVRGGDEIWAKTKLIVALRTLSRIVESTETALPFHISDARDWLAELTQPD